jgi:peptide/nickel transport system substrate-binding protein
MIKCLLWQRINKKFKKYLLLFYITIHIISGCGETHDDNTPEQTLTSDNFEVNTLIVGTTAPNDTFTLYGESGAFGKMNYNAFVSAPFWIMDSNGKINSFIVSDWTVDESAREITVTLALDQGVNWHDGKPLTIEDVLFTFEYLKTHGRSSYVVDVDHVERLSDNKIKIVLISPGAIQWIMLCAGYFTILPKHIWEKVDDPLNFTDISASIGSGPYKLTSIDNEAQISNYEAVGNTYLGRKLTVGKVSLRTYSSHDTLVMALKKGHIDAMFDYSNSLEATVAPAVLNVLNLNPGMSDNIGNYQIVYGFRRSPTDDLSFRKAVTLALDYELLRVTIGGQYGMIPSIGVIAPPNLGFDDSLGILVQDLYEANNILDDAGYLDIDGDGSRETPEGETMEVSIVPQYNRVKGALYLRLSEIIIKNLSLIGVKASLDDKSVSNSDYNATMRKSGGYQIFIGYTSPGMAKQTSAYYYFIDNKITNQWGTCDDPEFVDVYVKRMKSSTLEDYVELTKELQRINSKIYMAAPLCWNKSFFPFRTDKYEGWVNYPGWGGINFDTWYSLRRK